jgi:hypothetical protein
VARPQPPLGNNLHEYDCRVSFRSGLRAWQDGDEVHCTCGLRKLLLRAECLWTYDDHDDKWDTSCGHAHCFTTGGSDAPQENDHQFCPYCGGTLRAETPRHDAE